MVRRRSKVDLVGFLCMLTFASSALAQDAESGEFSASGSFRASGEASSAGSSGVSFEMQGRIDAFSTAGVESLGVPSGNGDLDLTLPAVPFMTLGVRLLDNDLFLGLGLGYASFKKREEPPIVRETVIQRNAFMLVPVVTYDVFERGMIALYPLGMLKIGKVGGGDNDPGGEAEGAFWWGLNLGIGLRANLTDHIAAMTEFGWGFERGSWSANDTDHTIFGHGFFGTLGLALNIGL